MKILMEIEENKNVTAKDVLKIRRLSITKLVMTRSIDLSILMNMKPE